MKISCLQENLSKGLSLVSRLVSTRGTLEILSHILISTDKGRIKLTTTNLEIGVNYKVGGKVDEEGSITVPARLLSELVAQLPNGKLSLNTEDSTVFLKSGDFESHIKGLSADEFPLIPKIKESKNFTISASDLKEVVGMVSFAAAIDETRPVLAGIYLNLTKDTLTLAATDSYRLAEKSVSIKNIKGKSLEVIVPARSLNELVRLFGDGDSEVSVYVDENQIMFETDDFEFVSRLVEGKFPDYKSIIPTESETKASVLGGEFGKIIKVAALFSGENVGSVILDIKTKGKLEAKSSSSQIGDSSAACDADVEGKDTEIVFNSKYLLDVVGFIGSERLILEVSGNLSAGVIRKDKDKSYVYVIMPLRA